MTSRVRYAGTMVVIRTSWLAFALVGSACGTNDPAPIGVVIGVGDNPSGTDCGAAAPTWYVFAPATASVKVDETFTWRNDASTTVTIEAVVDGTPLMTLAPGETGAPIAYKAAGVYRHGVRGCYLHTTSNVPPEPNGLGDIAVTVAFARL